VEGRAAGGSGIATVPASQWSVIEYRGREGLARLESDWRRLYCEMPDPSLRHSFEAFAVYVDTMCPSPERLRCLALGDGTRVRAILPVEERSDRALKIPLRVWGLPSRESWSLTDAIGPEDDARRALLPAAIDFLTRQPDRPSLLVLGPTPEASALWEGLRDLDPGRYYTFIERLVDVVPTDTPAEGILRRMSRNARYQVRKSEAAFASLADAYFVEAGQPAELAEEFERFLQVEASGWKGDRGSAIKSRPELLAFYRGLVAAMTYDGRCEVQALHAEGRCLAAHLVAFTGRQAAFLKIGYDETYARVAPGIVVTHKGLRSCCDDPDVGVVNMMNDALWHRTWRPRRDRSSQGVRGPAPSVRTGIAVGDAPQVRAGATHGALAQRAPGDGEVPRVGATHTTQQACCRGPAPVVPGM